MQRITNISKILKPVSGFAMSAPAAKSRESPGRIGVTTNPVSAKMIRKIMAYVHVW
jgi:hypothetical protein